jgi:hypothetical protein
VTTATTQSNGVTTGGKKGDFNSVIPADQHDIRLLGLGSFRYGQTKPPSIPVVDLFPNGTGFPQGETQNYKDEYVIIRY